MVDWAKVDDEIARQIVRHGELQVQAQLQTALAADQRSMTFSAVMAALTTLALGAALAILSDETPTRDVGIPMLVVGTVFVLSLFFAVLSARPIEFVFPGNHPKQLYENAAYLAGPISENLGTDAENYQTTIEANEKRMKKNARLLLCAYWLSFAAPILGALTWSYRTWV